MNHKYFMKQCIELGKKAMSKGNSPVGSLLIKNNEIIGIGLEMATSSKDITKHAEIEAIKDALNNHQDLSNTILYTTHEPCIMCAYVIRQYQINTIVYGMKSKYIGGHSSEYKVLETTHNPNWIVTPNIIGGVLECECAELSKVYKSKKRKL